MIRIELQDALETVAALGIRRNGARKPEPGRRACRVGPQRLDKQLARAEGLARLERRNARGDQVGDGWVLGRDGCHRWFLKVSLSPISGAATRAWSAVSIWAICRRFTRVFASATACARRAS